MRERLAQTSSGPVEIEIGENRVHGLWVSVTPFAESGWEARPTKALERWINVSVATVTVVVMLAVAGLGLVIWLLAT
jgi:hypothetical protein